MQAAKAIVSLLLLFVGAVYTTSHTHLVARSAARGDAAVDKLEAERHVEGAKAREGLAPHLSLGNVSVDRTCGRKKGVELEPALQVLLLRRLVLFES